MWRASRFVPGAFRSGPSGISRSETGRRISARRPVACAALAVLLLLVAGFPTDDGSPSAATAGDSAKVQVTARVLPRAVARVLSQPSPVLVTEEDVRRGYVDPSPAGVLVAVESNLPGGILLVFEGILRKPVTFRAAEIRGPGGPVRIDSSGGWVPVSHGKGRAVFRLKCRLLLGTDSRPGTYPWPYSLSARPL